MNKQLFNNSDELRSVFDLDSDPKYYDYIPFRDKEIGFSIKREYPVKIKYKPQKLNNGKPETVVLIRAHFIYPRKAKTHISNQKVRVNFDIGPFSEEPLTLSELSKDKNRPVGLDLRDEIYYDHATQCFIDKKGDKLTGKYILDALFKKHCETVHPIKGFKLRFKIRFKKTLISLIRFLIKICKWILRYPLGRVLESKDSFAGFAREYQKGDMKRIEAEVIKIHGVKASKNIFITFSVLLFVGLFIVKILHLNIPLIPLILSNTIFAFCFFIIFITILDYLFPRFFLKIINLLVKVHVKLIFLNFKQ